LPCTHDRSRRFENQNAHSVTGAARPLSTEPQPFDSAATERDSHGLHTAISPSAALLDATYTLLLSVIAFLNIVPNYSEKPLLCQTLFSTDLSHISGVDLTFFAFCFAAENIFRAAAAYRWKKPQNLCFLLQIWFTSSFYLRFCTYHGML
jgi:hypothetical protein